MMLLLRNVFGWLFSKFGLLVVLVFAGLCAPIVFQLITFAKDFDPQQILLEAQNISKEMAPVKDATAEQVKQRLRDLRAVQTQKVAERVALKDERCFLPTCTFINDGRIYKADLELDILGQAIAYGEAVKDGSNLCQKLSDASGQINLLVMLDANLNYVRPPLAPIQSSHQNIKDQIVALNETVPALTNGCSKFRQLSEVFDGKRSKLSLGVHAEFLKKVEELKNAKDAVWKAILEILPTALSVLMGIVAMPWIVSAVSFYGIAPLATRRFGVQLVPDSSGELDVELSSERSLKIPVHPGWEVLTDPGLVVGVPRSASAKMRILLDWSMPFSSLVSGLYLMTNIRSEQDEEVTLSARPFAAKPGAVAVHESSQIALLALPEKATLVLQPRSLVGIIQQIDKPIRITKHWRIGNLSSWATMQLRYIVFHGPAKLIVRGNGGVKVGMVNAEFSINQAATLGFSANLRYGVSRCENFYAYSSGKKELFDDNFSLGPGHYVEEVTPILVEGGPLRRPWEVLINAILRVFGLG